MQAASIPPNGLNLGDFLSNVKALLERNGDFALANDIAQYLRCETDRLPSGLAPPSREARRCMRDEGLFEQMDPYASSDQVIREIDRFCARKTDARGAEPLWRLEATSALDAHGTSRFERMFDNSFRLRWGGLPRSRIAGQRWLMMTLYEVAEQTAQENAIPLETVQWDNLLNIASDVTGFTFPKAMRSHFGPDVLLEQRLIENDPLRNTAFAGLALDLRLQILCYLVIDPQVVDAALQQGFSPQAILHAFEDDPGYAAGRLNALHYLFPSAGTSRGLGDLTPQTFWECHQRNIELGVRNESGKTIPSGVYVDSGVGFGVIPRELEPDKFQELLDELRAQAAAFNRCQTMFRYELLPQEGYAVWQRVLTNRDPLPTPSRQEAIEFLMSQAFDEFLDEVRQAKDDRAVLRAIIALAKKISLIHPARDANNRSACDLINLLAAVYLGQPPSSFDNPNDLEFRRIEDLMANREQRCAKLCALAGVSGLAPTAAGRHIGSDNLPCSDKHADSERNLPWRH